MVACAIVLTYHSIYTCIAATAAKSAVMSIWGCGWWRLEASLISM